MGGLHPGRASSDGTARFAQRRRGATGADAYRRFRDLQVSSVGIGTYLGAADDAVDAMYEAALARSIALGVNVVDCAINYRCQRSERAVGRALAAAFAAGEIARDELVVASKCGFLPYDGATPPDPARYLRQAYVESGLVPEAQLAAGCHSIAPAFVADQLARSRRNLGLETLDVYYLHNPETQLAEIDRMTFLDRIRRAFEVLEHACQRGELVVYGAATWSGFRVAPSSEGHLSLVELLAAAEEVAGPAHHFRVVQLPYNLVMREAATRATQRVPARGSRLSGMSAASGTREVTMLEAARELGVYVMGSAPIMQGKLASALPGDAVRSRQLQTMAQHALQFTRSTPGIGTALAGMKRVEHVEENCAVLRV